MAFSSTILNISEVNLKYPELASIDSNLMKKINKFNIYTYYEGTSVFLITHSDDVYAFGYNNKGRLGFGHEEEVKEPKIIPELSGKQVIDIKCGEYHSVALTQIGQIYTFGWSYDGRTGNGENCIYQKPLEISVDNQIIVAIDCTAGSTFVLTQSGQLYWFGISLWNNFESIAYTPTKVVFPSEVNNKSISCGENHILALTEDGMVFSWGDNIDGQLGHNNDTNSPQMISLNENIKQISCGYYHSLLLTTDGKVYSMGNNKYGQLGVGNKKNKNIPQLVLSEQKQICCYRDISMSFDINNKLYIWGNITEEGVVSPVLSELRIIHESFLKSFQEVVNKYSKHRSTLKPIELLKPLNSVIKATTKLFNNPENSDLKFKVKSKESCELKDIYCQKFFIKETNDYFQTMFANQWKENETNEIEINEYSYESYYLYLKSLHTDSIDTENMEELLEILSITDEYMDFDRKDNCVDLIKEKTNLENVCSVYSNAIKFNCVNLKAYAFEIMSENVRYLFKTQDYKNMDPIIANKFLTEFNKMQKNNRSQRKKAKTQN